MHKTKNTWRIDGDPLVLLNRTDGVEIYCPRAARSYVLQYTWSIQYLPNGKVQSVRTTIPHPLGGQRPSGRAKQLELKLHALILENAPEKVRQLDQTHIDHEDGNPLNNRLDNLRYVTPSVNHQNTRDAQGNPNRGVYHITDHYRSRPWRARIYVDGKQVGDEYFYTARAAEEQFLIWKRQYHPETPEVWYEQYAACQASGYWDAPAPTNSSAPAPATLFESMESR